MDSDRGENQEQLSIFGENMNLGRTDFYGMVNHVLTQHGKELGVFHVF